MGVDYVLFDKLVALSTRWQPKGRSLMLGRQGFKIQGPYSKQYEQTLRKHRVDGRRFDFLQDDGFSETLMEKLGFGPMESMDFADYEGATHLHDLNRPAPRNLREKFDFIFDGGTIEHVFNVPQALETVYRMLKPGGRFVSANGMNGWPGHGMYQFNPELVWTFWQRACNCVVHECSALPKLPGGDYAEQPFEDPAISGRRIRMKGKIGPGRTYLYYEVEKTEDSHPPTFALQSDYEVKWQGSETAGQTRFEEDAR